MPADEIARTRARVASVYRARSRRRNGLAASSSSTACATSTRSRAQKSRDRRGEFRVGDRVRRLRRHRHQSARELVHALRAAFEPRDARSMQNSIAW